LGTRFAKLRLGETGSWSFPRRIPKQELGNEGERRECHRYRIFTGYWFPTSTLGISFAKLQLGETETGASSAAFPSRSLGTRGNGAPVFAEVTVRFEPAEQYTDLGLSGASTPAVQESLLKQLEKHLKQLGESDLPKGDTLEIEIRDVDMAGATEPWHSPNLINTRIIRDIYPPRLTRHYLWRDKTGRIKADREEKPSDLNYLMRLDAARYLNNDPLRYEKALLDRWFKETFAAKPKQ